MEVTLHIAHLKALVQESAIEYLKEEVSQCGMVRSACRECPHMLVNGDRLPERLAEILAERVKDELDADQSS